MNSGGEEGSGCGTGARRYQRTRHGTCRHAAPPHSECAPSATWSRVVFQVSPLFNSGTSAVVNVASRHTASRRCREMSDGLSPPQRYTPFVASHAMVAAYVYCFAGLINSTMSRRVCERRRREKYMFAYNMSYVGVVTCLPTSSCSMAYWHTN